MKFGIGDVHIIFECRKNRRTERHTFMKCCPIFYIFSSDLDRNRYRRPGDVVEQGRVS